MDLIHSGIFQSFIHTHRYLPDAATNFVNATFAKTVFTGSNTTYIDISNNQGISFSRVDFSSQIGAGETIIDFDFEGSNVVILTTTKALVSNDYGNTFSNITANISSYYDGFNYCRYKDGRLFVSHTKGFGTPAYRYSDNSGSSFTLITETNTGQGQFYLPTKTTGTVLMGDNLIVNASKALYINNLVPTNDYFPTQGSSSPINIGQYSTSQNYASVPPNSTSVIYASVIFSGDAYSYIYKSTTTGTTSFTLQKTLGISNSPVIGASTDTTVFIGYTTSPSTTGVLYQSTDSGLNFSPVFSATSKDIIGIKFNTSTNGVIIVNDVYNNSDTYYTTDGGANWYISAGNGTNDFEYINVIKSSVK